MNTLKENFWWIHSKKYVNFHKKKSMRNFHQINLLWIFIKEISYEFSSLGLRITIKNLLWFPSKISLLKFPQRNLLWSYIKETFCKISLLIQQPISKERDLIKTAHTWSTLKIPLVYVVALELLLGASYYSSRARLHLYSTFNKGNFNYSYATARERNYPKRN